MININDPETLERYLKIKEEKTSKEVINNYNILKNKIKNIKDKEHCGHYDHDVFNIDHGSFHQRGGEYK